MNDARTCPLLYGIGLSLSVCVSHASAADVTGASIMLTNLLGSANSWASQIIVAMLILGLVVISMTHFADLRQVLAIPLTIAVIAALVVFSPQLVNGVGLVAGATLEDATIEPPVAPVP